MKYLEKSFSLSMNIPKTRYPFFDQFDEELKARDRKRDKPHEYENGGAMCGLCGLDRRAKIHA